jgi:hypothetical protein
MAEIEVFIVRLGLLALAVLSTCRFVCHEFRNLDVGHQRASVVSPSGKRRKFEVIVRAAICLVPLFRTRLHVKLRLF